jgi:predicted RNA-binding protein (virulence factor B family)
MAAIGKMNLLEVVKTVDFGVYLKSDTFPEILLPRKYVPRNCQIGDKVNVFVHKDSEDRIIATTQVPAAMVGDYACLKATHVTDVGAFLDWGLLKDLFVPFREQKIPMEEGNYYTVHIYLDEETDRIAASSKVHKYLNKEPVTYETGQEVEVMVIYRTDLGYKCIIEQTHTGVLYENEVFAELEQGQVIKAFIKKIRPDEKIDLSLQKQGYARVEGLPEQILEKLKAQAGFMPLNSKSAPDVIYQAFGVSKKTFKMAVSNLYKSRLITIEDNGIRLAHNE